MQQRLVFSLLLLTAGPAFALAPPATPQHDVMDNDHGTQIHDPYRWLEHADAPAVKQWIDAQGTDTEGVIGAFKEAKTIAERVDALALTSGLAPAPKTATGKNDAAALH